MLLKWPQIKLKLKGTDNWFCTLRSSATSVLLLSLSHLQDAQSKVTILFVCSVVFCGVANPVFTFLCYRIWLRPLFVSPFIFINSLTSGWNPNWNVFAYFFIWILKHCVYYETSTFWGIRNDVYLTDYAYDHTHLPSTWIYGCNLSEQLAVGSCAYTVRLTANYMTDVSRKHLARELKIVSNVNWWIVESKSHNFNRKLWVCCGLMLTGLQQVYSIRKSSYIQPRISKMQSVKVSQSNYPFGYSKKKTQPVALPNCCLSTSHRALCQTRIFDSSYIFKRHH